MVLLPTGAGGMGAPEAGRTGGGGASGPVGRGAEPIGTVPGPTGRTGGGALRSGTVGAPAATRGAGGGIETGGGETGTCAVGGGGATGARGSDGGALGRSVIRTVSFFSGTADVLTVGAFGIWLSGSLMGNRWKSVRCDQLGEFPNVCQGSVQVSTLEKKDFHFVEDFFD